MFRTLLGCLKRLKHLPLFLLGLAGASEVMILGDESLDAIDEDCLWTDEPMERLGRRRGGPLLVCWYL